MRINTYSICQSIADRLKSKIMGSTEANELQAYSQDNFGKETLIYNQIAVNKNDYPLPYVAISTIGERRKIHNEVAIDIDFAIPQEKVKALIEDGVVVYENRYKLAEFAEIIMNIIDKENCTGFDNTEMVFRPNDVAIGTNEYSGNIQITYRIIIPISKFQ